MKTFKFILLLICTLGISNSAYSQTVRSYGAISVTGTMGPQSVPHLAISIEYHDGYILLNGYEKYVYRATNYDGSMQYYPVSSGDPTLRTTGILISGDYSYVRQFSESIMMGMRMELVYDFSFIGNGYEAAQNYMGTNSGGYYGGSSYGNSSRDWANCSSCGGAGRCSYCGGSGRDSYTSTGRCEVCRGTGKCAGCDGKGGYSY